MGTHHKKSLIHSTLYPQKTQFPCGDYQLDVFEGDAVDGAPIYSTSAHCDGYRVAHPGWNDQFSTKEGEASLTMCNTLCVGAVPDKQFIDLLNSQFTLTDQN